MAATRTGPPTPPPGRPRPGPEPASQAAGAGLPAAPPLPPRAADALRALTATADADGLVAVDLRSLAAELDVTTLTARALLTALVEAGALGGVGRRVWALDGSRADAGDPSQPPEPRTPPHDAVHEGTGSPLLW